MGLLNTAVKGIAWSSLSTVIRSIVSLLQVSILTRYLEKTDFGIVAIATLFIGFIQIFMDLGLSVGIIHKQNISARQYSSLFWLNIFSGGFLTLLLLFLSPVVAEIYNEDSLTKILSLLSLNIFFSSLGSQHRTVQQKMLRFKYIAIIEIITSILTLLIAVVLVENGYGIYSLVYSTMFNILISNLLFLFIGLYKDRNISFHFNFSDTFPFLKIGFFSVGTQVLDYFSREIDIILISATLGKDVLGAYSLCKKLVMSVYSAINPIVAKVLAPLFALIQNDISKIRKIYYDVIETVALVNFPIYFWIAIFSYSIIYYLYGENYTDNAIVLSLLAVYYGYLSTGSPVGSLQTALGRTDSGFYWTIFRIVFCLIAIYIGSQFSVTGVVLSLIIMNFVAAPAAWYVNIRPLIAGRFIPYFFKAFRPFLITLAVSLPFAVLCHYWTSIWQILLLSILFVSVYGVVTISIMKHSYVVTYLRQLMNK